MNLDLCSQIKLTEIPERYFSPRNAFEQTALTRYEKVQTFIYPTVDDAVAVLAKQISDAIRKAKTEGDTYSMALPGGNSPLNLYKELIRMHKEEGLSFSNVIVFLQFEFYPLAAGQAGNLEQVKNAFLNHVDIDPKNIYAPTGAIPKEEIFNFCCKYEETIKLVGGIDLMLLGIGKNSHIMFNLPGTNPNSSTRLVLIDSGARKEASRSFQSSDAVPAGVITMGLSTMRKAKSIVLIAFEEYKADIIAKTVESPLSDTLPSTSLQTHANAKVIVDLATASQLTRLSNPWLVTNCDWDNKLIRRAIVWLSLKTDKPILKLTSKDYSENGLGELLAIYGSAYNVNIKVFNEIQHTITGWPGGKPNADDTDRPERALPYPKRVILFSPHPDDDVISMGGTFRRLCDQDHEVHVAYQTSGNIAVADEEVIRYCEYLMDVCDRYTPDSPLVDKAKEIVHYLSKEKLNDESQEKPDVLFMKGTIRREEARHGARHAGITDDKRIHFLDLPFYETGMVKKNPISEKDVNIIVDYISSIKPHQLFVAGDLADPHGTHRVCLNAILAAVDILKGEEWMKECKVWMYRGAWAEWEMDHIEMAVPISPEEMKLKKIAILKHQSQAESAPFLGNDERLFWQRAEDRNQATAELYRKLGLASYEAMEAFVEYKF